MSIFKYIIRSLKYYRKQHLAVFAGTIISTAVLTGALIVGDSVRNSLKHLVDVRLGNISFVMQSGDRFFQSGLDQKLEAELESQLSTVLMLKGIGVNPELEKRVNGIQVTGITADFGSLFNVELEELAKGEAMVSSNLASKLNLAVGDEFLLRVEQVSEIPLNAPFSQDVAPSKGLRVKVRGVLRDEQPGRFSLKSNQAAPYNVFVNREFLAQSFDLDGLANTILAEDKPTSEFSPSFLNDQLTESWALEDLGIQINDLSQQGKYEIQSSRIFIDEPIVRSVLDLNINAEPVLTYLVNAIRFGEKNTPYSFVSAVSSEYLKEELSADGIIINEWLSADLNAGIGDTISLDYFVVGPLRKLNEKSKKFIIRDIARTGQYPADSSLMPDFPGLTEADNCSDWETGIPIDLELIRDKDEFYWDDYKGTPKGLILFKKGEEIWKNDFGRVTALRVDKKDISLPELQEAILTGVNPIDLNLSFRSVRQEGQLAATNSVDFGELFLSLSFFVILAGIILTILLFTLQTESRMMESGVLTAMGYSKKLIVFIRFSESFLIALGGGIVGAFLGIAYNNALIAGLNSVWTDAVHTNVLQVFILPNTLLTGAISGVIISLLSIYLVSVRKLKNPVTTLLKNYQPAQFRGGRFKFWLPIVLLIFGLIGSLILVFYSFNKGIEQSAGLFLAAGGLFILVMLTGVSLYLRYKSQNPGNKEPGIMQLALINASRNKARSMTTITLFALGTFTIIITGANRKSFYGAEENRQSGTGGFSYWAETTMPIPYDLKTGDGRTKLGIEDGFTENNIGIVQLLALEGDDASCLNLNQVEQPRILGVDPSAFQDRNAFSFATFLKKIDPDSVWSELDKSYGPDVIPAYADQTVITWGLIKKVGDTLHYRNEAGEPIKLLLAGGFKNSIFQGNLLIGMDHFRKNFPSASGSGILLIEGSKESTDKLARIFERQLVDYGVTLTGTRDKMAQFNSVENTYLSVFMALGGLGVIIGTLGLGIVIMRNVLERKKELALMTAVGFQRKDLVKLFFFENVALLIVGFFSGVIGALIGILPSFLSPAFTIPGFFMIWLLIAVFASGLIWIWFPARQLTKLPLIESLNSE